MEERKVNRQINHSGKDMVCVCVCSWHQEHKGTLSEEWPFSTPGAMKKTWGTELQAEGTASAKGLRQLQPWCFRDLLDCWVEEDEFPEYLAPVVRHGMLEAFPALIAQSCRWFSGEKAQFFSECWKETSVGRMISVSLSRIMVMVKKRNTQGASAWYLFVLVCVV